jgi:hypothetical protein
LSFVIVVADASEAIVTVSYLVEFERVLADIDEPEDIEEPDAAAKIPLTRARKNNVCVCWAKVYRIVTNGLK